MRILKHSKKAMATLLAVVMMLSLAPAVVMPASQTASASTPPLRKMEYLSRGLIAAERSDGIFLSWRFLGDEPDGLSWNIYRSDNAGTTWSLIATVAPRDVQPESNFPTNPGIVKTNTTPTNYLDAAGTATSIYEVAAVFNGFEVNRSGMSVPMLTPIAPGGDQANRGASHTFPIVTPQPLPRPMFHYRGGDFGTGAPADNSAYVDLFNITTRNTPTGNSRGWVTTENVAEADLTRWRTALRHFTNDYTWTWTEPHTAGTPISEALRAEFEAKFEAGGGSARALDVTTPQAIRDAWARYTEVTDAVYNGWIATLRDITRDAGWSPTELRDVDNTITDELYLELMGKYDQYFDGIIQTKRHWEVVDMDLLREFKIAFEREDGLLEDGVTEVTQAILDDWVDRLNAHNEEENRLGNAVYDTSAAGYEPWEPTADLGNTSGGTGNLVTLALYKELEAEFIKYVENMDSGDKLPYARTNTGAIRTTMAAAYSPARVSVADFDGDGEYEIIILWTSSGQDPMVSEPLMHSTSVTGPPVVDVYKLDGTPMFRVDMGYNTRSSNGHETTIYAGLLDMRDNLGVLGLKTGLGARIGNWNGTAFVYEDTAATVVGGTRGLNATTAKFAEYFEAGNVAALDQYYNILNSFTISYRSSARGGGNDGFNIPEIKNWIKTYHIGPIGPAPTAETGEFFTMFKVDPATGRGYIVGSTEYEFPYQGSTYLADFYNDPSLEKNWAMTPNSQRGNYSYHAFPHRSALSDPEGYKAQYMMEREAYWLGGMGDWEAFEAKDVWADRWPEIEGGRPWMESVWGDAQGNRASRYIGVTASLDGVNWFAVSGRGMYHRTTLAAYHINMAGEVALAATFDSRNPAHWTLGNDPYHYENRGNHQLVSGDLNFDGPDEIIYRGFTLNLNGNGTFRNYNGNTNKTPEAILPIALNGDYAWLTEDYHADGATVPPRRSTEFHGVVSNGAMRVGHRVWHPYRHGDRNFLLPNGERDANGNWKIVMKSPSEEHYYDNIRTGEQYGFLTGVTVHDPLKGKTKNPAFGQAGQPEFLYEESGIYSLYAGRDEGGTAAGNFTNRFPGGQAGGPGNLGTMTDLLGEVRSILTGRLLTNADGSRLNTVPQGLPGNSPIWFGGGLTHMLVNGANIVSLNENTLTTSTWLATGASPIGRPVSADLFGDWRQEIISATGTGNNRSIVIVSSVIPTQYGIRTLMHDPFFRQAIANSNTSYNSDPFASFYLGDEAPLPSQRTDLSVPTNSASWLSGLSVTIAGAVGTDNLLAGFTPDKFSFYEIEVANNIREVTIDATPMSSGATVRGDGDSSLAEGPNVLTVAVDSGAATSFYTIVINRAASSVGTIPGDGGTASPPPTTPPTTPPEEPEFELPHEELTAVAVDEETEEEAAEAVEALADELGAAIGADITQAGAAVAVSTDEDNTIATITMPSGTNVAAITTMAILSDDGGLTAVPTVIKDGKVVVLLKKAGDVTLVPMNVSVDFPDITRLGSRVQEEINRAASLMIVQGTGGGVFTPSLPVSVQQTVTMFLRTLGIPVNYEDAIATGAANGLTVPGTLPGEPMSRIATAVLIADILRGLGLDTELDAAEIDSLLSQFSDLRSLSSAQRADMAICVKLGIFMGNGNGTMTPNVVLQRSHMASLSVRLLDLIFSF